MVHSLFLTTKAESQFPRATRDSDLHPLFPVSFSPRLNKASGDSIPRIHTETLTSTVGSPQGENHPKMIGMAGAGYPGYEISDSPPVELRNLVVRPPPKSFAALPLPPKKLNAWHYGVRVTAIHDHTVAPGVQFQQEDYEIWRLWDDCLRLQRNVEKEYARLSNIVGEGPSNALYPSRRAASFDSLPSGSDHLSLSTDVHDAGMPKLSKKAILFRSNTVDQRGDQFGSFILELFTSNHPVVIQVLKTTAVRNFFAWWKRDRDSSTRVASPSTSLDLTRSRSTSTSLGSVAGGAKPGSRSSVSSLSPIIVSTASPSTPSLAPIPLSKNSPVNDPSSPSLLGSDPFHRVINGAGPAAPSSSSSLLLGTLEGPILRRPSTAPGGPRARLLPPVPRTPLPPLPSSRNGNGLRVDTNGSFRTSPTTIPSMSQSSPSLLAVDAFATANPSWSPPPPYQEHSSSSNGVTNRPRSASLEGYDSPKRGTSSNMSRARTWGSQSHTFNPSRTAQSPVREEEEDQPLESQGLAMARATLSHAADAVSRESPPAESSMTAAHTLRRPRPPSEVHNAKNRNVHVFVFTPISPPSTSQSRPVQNNDETPPRGSQEFMQDFEILSPTQEELPSIITARMRLPRLGHRSTSSFSSIATSVSDSAARDQAPNSFPSSRPVSAYSTLTTPRQFFYNAVGSTVGRSPLEAGGHPASDSECTSPSCHSPSQRDASGHDHLSAQSHAEARLSRSSKPVRRSLSAGPRQRRSFHRASSPLEETDDDDISEDHLFSPGQDELIDSYLYGSGSSNSGASVRAGLRTLDTPPLSRPASISSRRSFSDLFSRGLLSLDEEPDPSPDSRRESLHIANPERFPRPFQNRPPGQFHLPWSQSMTSLPSSSLPSTAPLKYRPSKSSLRPSANPIPMVFTAKVVHVPSGSAVLIKLPRNVALEEVRTKIEKKFQEIESLELSLSSKPTLQPGGSARCLSLYCRNPLGQLSPPSTPGRNRCNSILDGPDVSQYAHIVTEEDWVRAVASIDFGDKMSLRIFDEECFPTSAV